MPSFVEITSLPIMQTDISLDFCCFVSAIMVVFWIIIAVFVYRDAEERGMSGGTWALLALLFGLIALIIYLFVREAKVPARYRPIRYDSPVGQPPVSPQAPGPHLTPPVRYSPPRPDYCSVCGRKLIEKTLLCPLCDT
ncbi:MAG: hypothetical protein KAR39_09385 [Thermoplasmata archaeon]|nr:hypothetical protein [Thermoplasmata archaeon]